MSCGHTLPAHLLPVPGHWKENFPLFSPFLTFLVASTWVESWLFSLAKRGKGQAGLCVKGPGCMSC